ncbi:MAG TPA: cell wall-binding repeat-containing protein [Solirubrobacterales bacterium]|nr:cell wall-binding repeat-containing protein [Solirubrobacterales bacterium]
MIPKRPINADVPTPEPETQQLEPVEKEAPEKKSESRWRQAEEEPKRSEPTPPREPKPLAPKLLAALAALAVVFIVVAIVFSGGGKNESSNEGAAAPRPAAPGKPDEAPVSQTPEALGYPSFATNNTTRIGGSDPAANAAAVALAVFPSTTPAQRPTAVTLVNEEDWAGAIAASVLMAAPVRAPILFSRPDELPEASEEALDALDFQGGKATGGAAFFAIGTVSLPGGARATRVDSGDPASTAAQIATLRDRLFGKPPAAILIASSSSPDFAMPAAAWAARSGDPVLYADAKKLPAATAAVLSEHPKTPVFVLGPSGAVSAAALKEIEKLSKRVKRVAGNDPAANAIALARLHDGSFGWNVNDPGHGFVLARSDSPADAAAAAPLSASGTWGPLLLTEGAGTLPDAVRNYLLDVKPGYTTDPTRAFYNRFWLIGDQDAIGVGQQAEVNELAELAKIGGEP